MKSLILLVGAGMILAACSGGADQTEGDAERSAGAQIAADVPDTEIYLGSLTWSANGPALGELRNITGRPGYDNQPKFMPDGRSLVYTSIRDGEQSDIYRYLIDDQQTLPYTLTPESEYSPTPLPGQSGISVVRVEADGTQRLWRFPAANAEPTVLFPTVAGVGYHAWLNETRVAMFIVAEPPSLLVVDSADGQQRKVATAIGRSLARMPGENAFAFISKEGGEPWRVARYDMGTSSLAELIDTPPGSEDFAWTPEGGLFMGNGTELVYWDGQLESGWQRIADLDGAVSGGRITRLDVSPDGGLLALVVAPDAVQ